MMQRHLFRGIRLLRSFHTSSDILLATKPPPAPINTSPTSTTAPFPPLERPPDNDPNYIHPPSSVKAGSLIRGVQILKDKPEIVALPDDYYPDWLWELLDDPQSVQERHSSRKEVEKKKNFYLAQLREEARERWHESTKTNRVKTSGKRTKEQRREGRRLAQNAAWIVNRDREYDDIPQYDMPPERNAKYHNQINKQNIKEDNYLRARGMK